MLATGVVNNRPNMPNAIHDEALEAGLLRYCPICDGYEVTDKRVGIIGTGNHGMREALFLRGYTKDVTLIAPEGGHDLDPACEAALDGAGIVRVGGPCGDYAIEGDKLALKYGRGTIVVRQHLSGARIGHPFGTGRRGWRTRIGGWMP